MKTLPKILSGLLLLAAFASFSAQALAQNTVINPLDDIKTQLEEGNIHVIDYSSPQGEWGYLSSDWIKALQDAGVENLESLAADFEGDFEGEGGILWLRHQISVLEARKSRAETEAERNDIQNEIDVNRSDLEASEESVKSDLASKAAGAEGVDTAAAGDLLFQEMDFFYSYNKWGRLPFPVSEALKSEDALWQGEDIKDLTTLNRLYAGDAESLKADLEGLAVEEADGTTRALRSDEIDLIAAEALATGYRGESQLNAVAQAVFNFIQNIIAGLAVVFMVFSAARLVLAQGDESVITEQKKSLLYSVIGLAAILLLGRLIDFIYGPAGLNRTVLTPSAEFDAEVYGVISFIKAVIGAAAIAMIIKSGVQSITSAGDEAKLTEQKKAVGYVLAGLILVAIDRVFIENLYIHPVTQDDQILAGNVTSVIGTIGTVLMFTLSFAGLIALGVLIYGASLMLTAYADEERVTKAKSIIKNAVIGLLVIIAAYTVVATLIVFR